MIFLFKVSFLAERLCYLTQTSQTYADLCESLSPSLTIRLKTLGIADSCRRSDAAILRILRSLREAKRTLGVADSCRQ